MSDNPGPRVLDLFCGAGGAAMGYQRAGFYVVGVDIDPQPNYCGDEFVQLDALALLDTYLTDGEGIPFDVIHASPPCQAYAGLAAKDGRHPRLIEPVQQLFGEQLYMHQFKINAKAKFDGDVWQWHQDYGTWARDDGMPEPRAMISRSSSTRSCRSTAR